MFTAKGKVISLSWQQQGQEGKPSWCRKPNLCMCMVCDVLTRVRFDFAANRHTDGDHQTDTSVKWDCEQAFLPGFPGASIESLSYHPIFLMESWSCSSLAVFFLNSLLNQFSSANLSYFVCCDLGGLTQEAWLTTSGLTRNGGEKPVRWSSHQHSYIC